MTISREGAQLAESFETIPRYAFEQEARLYRQYRDPVGLEAIRHYIATQPVVHYNNPGNKTHVIRLPHNSGNSVIVDRERDNTARLTDAYVQEPLRRMGVGTRMYQAMAVLLRSMDIQTFESSSVTTDALRVRASVFGPESMQFYAPGKPDEILPLTFAEAFDRAMHIEDAAAMSGLPLTYLGVHTDLTGIDVSQWEMPEYRGRFISSNLGV